MYYRGAQAAIVVYDITSMVRAHDARSARVLTFVARQDSFERAKAWIKELQRQVSKTRVAFIRRFIGGSRRVVAGQS